MQLQFTAIDMKRGTIVVCTVQWASLSDDITPVNKVKGQ